MKLVDLEEENAKERQFVEKCIRYGKHDIRKGRPAMGGGSSNKIKNT